MTSFPIALHPLALEDLLSDRKLARSKSDYFPKHLFLRIVCHELMDEKEATTYFPNTKRSASPSRMSSQATLAEDEDAAISEKGTGLRKRRKARDLEASIDSQSSFRAPSEVESNVR